jgi:hypothetical protein
LKTALRLQKKMLQPRNSRPEVAPTVNNIAANVNCNFLLALYPPDDCVLNIIDFADAGYADAGRVEERAAQDCR